MPYVRENTWDIINPYIELAQELTSVRIWDQQVKWGISWGAYLETSRYAVGTNADAIYSTGTGLSLIDAVLSINDGVIPTTNTTWLFGVNGPVELWTDATMAIGCWWYNGHAFFYLDIGSTGMMSYSGFENMFNYVANNLQYKCNYAGVDPDNITNADKTIFTTYFCTASVTDDASRHSTMPQSAVKTWQIGDCYNTYRTDEPLTFLLNDGYIYPFDPLHPEVPPFYYLPKTNFDDPDQAPLYYKYGRDFTPGWHFPYDLATDLNDFYEEDIEEGEIGGDGDFSISGDSLGVPPLPNIGILQSGMVKLYLPTVLELRSFAQELWTDNASIAAAFGAMVASPIEAVINLGLLPLDLSTYRASSTQVQMGSYTMTTTMSPCDNEWYKMDFGTIVMPEKWGSALDYSPYTTLKLYLPYVGYVDLPPEETLKHAISVFYYINLFTGDFVAWVYSTLGSESKPIMQYTGNCMFKMPITAMDYSAYYKNQHDTMAGAISNFASGNVLGGLIDTVAFAAGSANPSGNVKRCGEFSGSTAIMAYPQPFIIRTIPRQVFQGSRQDQSGFDKYVGFPSYKILTLSSGMGFCKINDIILDDLVLTDEEEKELRAILKEGVYL